MVGGQVGAAEDPRSVLSPLTNSLLEQLEAQIKDLKAWLRDTELLIFNSCLRQKDASLQLPSFKVGPGPGPGPEAGSPGPFRHHLTTLKLENQRKELFVFVEKDSYFIGKL